MKFNIVILLVLLFSSGWSQTPAPAVKQKQDVIRMTGVRFAYPLVQYWIDKYTDANPDVQIIIEWRGTQDPSEYDILVEAYPHPEEIRKQREYINIARYAILPVANSKSDFARTYSVKGLNKELIKQVYFYDMFVDKDNEQKIKAPFTVYTRTQKAGAPMVFARYFGFEQKDIVGKGIAGSDEHLLKAMLRDSTGVSYLPLPLVYEKSTKKPVVGLSVLPVDLNGNGRVADDEKFYDDLPTVIQRLNSTGTKELNNVPMEYIHFSVDKSNATPQAIAFLRWIVDKGLADLDAFGFLQPEPARMQKASFEEFASKHF